MFPVIVGLLGWEGLWWMRRRSMRRLQFERARRIADLLGRPLAVVGAPDSGMTAGYPCGDITLDIQESDCPNSFILDLNEPLPFESDSLVVFASCVFEYVDDYPLARAELIRVSGGYLFNVRVEPWTLAAYFYPKRRRLIGSIGMSS